MLLPGIYNIFHKQIYKLIHINIILIFDAFSTVFTTVTQILQARLDTSGARCLQMFAFTDPETAIDMAWLSLPFCKQALLLRSLFRSN